VPLTVIPLITWFHAARTWRWYSFLQANQRQKNPAFKMEEQRKWQAFEAVSAWNAAGHIDQVRR